MSLHPKTIDFFFKKLYRFLLFHSKPKLLETVFVARLLARGGVRDAVFNEDCTKWKGSMEADACTATKEGTAMTESTPITLASGGQLDAILRLIQEVGRDELRRLGVNKDDAQRLLGKGGEFKGELARVLGPLIRRFSTASNIVVVPDMAAVELTAATKRDLRLTHLDGDYAAWDFYCGVNGHPIEGRGQKLEALIVPKTDIKPSGETVSLKYAWECLLERGYIGHVGGFTQWRRQNRGLMGYHLSIPEDNACWRHSDGDLCVPFSYFNGDSRELGRRWLGYGLIGGESVVGFRVVS